MQGQGSSGTPSGAPPGSDRPRPGSAGEQAIILDRGESPPPPASGGRFPVRPEPYQPPSSPSSPLGHRTVSSGEAPVSENRQASVEARMLALEHDYAQSAESWRESSLAMVRALEILESRIGPSTGQPLGGMGEGAISNELSALRADIAQLRTRIDGFLPPPPGQGFSAPQMPRAGMTRDNIGVQHTPPHGTMPGATQGAAPYAARSYAPPRPARLQRHAGQAILSLLITSVAITLAWFVATHLDSVRDTALREGFRHVVGDKPEVSLYRPPAGRFTRLPTGDGKTLTPPAHYEKALVLYRGARGTQDITRAAAHFDAAASQGMAAAQFWLGYFYEKGLGVEASVPQAAKLYGQAGAKGHIKAMHNLGVLYLEGRGVDYDVASASEWLLRASSYGFAESMNLLGYINEEGLLGSRNLKYAYAWYSLAARMGHRGAQEHAPRLVVSLSRRDRREAEALVNGWRINDADPVINEGPAIKKDMPMIKFSSPQVQGGPRLARGSSKMQASKLFSHRSGGASYAAPYVAPRRPHRGKR